MSRDLTALVGTAIGGWGRDRASGVRWRRVTAGLWDLWHRSQCPCEHPRWKGLDLVSAADRVAAETPIQPATGGTDGH